MTFSFIGSKPRPSVLLIGQVPNGLDDVISRFTPSWRRIASWHAVHQAEWDCVVSFGEGASGAHFGLDVLSFGAGVLGSPPDTGDSYELAGSTTADVLAVPQSLLPRISTAVHRTLVPVESKKPKHVCIRRGSWSSEFFSSFEPFLLASTGAALAGRFQRSDTGTEVWALPDYAPFELWFRTALETWHERDPSRYPLRGGWRDRAAWQTQRQRAAAKLTRRIEARRAELLSQLDQEEAAATQQLLDASVAAEADERRLLLTQGADLVDAVASALRKLGFEVDDMDAVFPDGQRREDLRVRHPSQADWVAVVEVKGYARGGGATGDLAKLQRWCHLYERDERREPNAAWYVVNQFFENDPSERPKLLASNESDVGHLVDHHHGLLIDTAELFRLVTADDGPSNTAEQLMETTGRLL